MLKLQQMFCFWDWQGLDGTYTLPVGVSVTCMGTETPKPVPWDSHSNKVSGTSTACSKTEVPLRSVT